MTTEQNDYSVTELARAGGVDRSYIARLCKRGDIAAHRIGNMYVIPFEVGRRWLAEREKHKQKK